MIPRRAIVKGPFLTNKTNTRFVTLVASQEILEFLVFECRRVLDRGQKPVSSGAPRAMMANPAERGAVIITQNQYEPPRGRTLNTGIRLTRHAHAPLLLLRSHTTVTPHGQPEIIHAGFAKRRKPTLRLPLPLARNPWKLATSIYMSVEFETLRSPARQTGLPPRFFLDVARTGMGLSRSFQPSPSMPIQLSSVCIRTT